MTIENLEIEITATSDQATLHLDKLRESLERIKSFANDSGLDKLYKKLKKIASLDFSGTASGMDKMAHSADKMSKAGNRVDGFVKSIKRIREETHKVNEEFTQFGSGRVPLLGSATPLFLNEPVPSSGGYGETGSKVPSFGGFLPPSPSYPIPSGNSSESFGGISGLLGDGTIYLNDDQWKENKFAEFMDGVKSKVGNSFSKLWTDIKSTTSAMKSLNKETKNTNSSFNYLRKTVIRFAIYKMLNVIVKNFTAGLQNIAMYSEKANETLTKYRSLATNIGNSLAASVIPFLEVMYPLVSTLANGLIDLANAFNLLWAKMSGATTFIKAKKYTDDYAKSLGKVRGTAGIDELHTISNSTQYSEMFEEVEVSSGNIAGSIATITQGIAAIAGILVGLNIIKWVKFFMTSGMSLTGALQKIAPILKTIGGVLLVIVGAAELIKGMSDAIINGLNWENFLQIIIGIGVAVGGLALLFGSTGVAIGLVVGGIAMVVTGIIDIVKNGASLQNWLTVIVGILAVGAGIAIAVGGWIPLAIAAVVAALASLVIWGDQIVAWLDNFKGLFDGWITGIKENIFGFFDRIIDKVKNFCPGLAMILEVVKNYIGAVFDFVKANFDWAITLIRDFVKLISDLFHGDFKAVWEDLKKFFSDFWKGFVNVAIVPINFLISCFESLVNFFIRGINMIITGINKISFDVPDWVPGIGGKKVGFNIGQVSEVKFGRVQGYATGGFPEDGLFMANHSEMIGQFSNGRTAVANNEQIVSGISRGVSEASMEQNELLREQNKLLARLLNKDSSAVVSVSTITKGLERQNRRNGKTIVPVGN